MTHTTQVEIVAQDPAGARIAFDNGADRIELCQALSTGGMTPSLGLLEATIAAVGGERIALLVRPRPGGFVYDADEVEIVAADIRAAVSRGVGGVVVGALTRELTIDTEALARWRDAAGDADLVFHRAVDVLTDQVSAIDVLADAGVKRVLTSGGAPASLDGADNLRRMVERAAGRLEIQAGGGVTIAAIPTLIAAGVDAVHLSARGTSTNDAPSGPGGGATGYDVTLPELVQDAVRAARG